jgi:hypothetical protein
VRPEAASPEVLRPKAAAPKAAAPLRASRRAWLATERRQTRMLRKVAAAPEAPAGAASGRVVSGAAAEGRSTAVKEQTRVM